MLPALAELSLRGSLAFILVWIIDRLLMHRISARSRRAWWWLVAAGFLVPLQVIPMPEWAGGVSKVTAHASTLIGGRSYLASPDISLETPLFHFVPSLLLMWIWLGGAVSYLGVIVLRTIRTQRHWARQRLCTDPALLNLLEDCKERAGVSAPIGLVRAGRLGSPALLGWLRPRILIPAKLALGGSRMQLRAVFFHELAHHRAFDLGLHWLFQLVTALHWFNPFAHLAVREWLRFRELAADEQALAWLAGNERETYGETLIATLRQQNGFPTPSGALALGESLQDLKQRITMLAHHPRLRRHRLASLAFGFFIATTLLFQTARAENDGALKARAAQSAALWLDLLDKGQYDPSWEQASPQFRDKVTKEQWKQSLGQVRTPLGNLHVRKTASLLLQSAPTNISGEKHLMAVIQYHSSFENLSSALETVTFFQEQDGKWRAAGYFIKPN